LIKEFLEAAQPEEQAISAQRARRTLKPEDLKTVKPSLEVAKMLLNFCNGMKEDEEVKGMVKRLKGVLKLLFSESGVVDHKHLFVKECTKVAVALGVPRLNKASALIEVVFDALNLEDLIDEETFLKWFEDTNDDTPGKEKVLFQVSN
jgi:hypothetical protein